MSNSEPKAAATTPLSPTATAGDYTLLLLRQRVQTRAPLPPHHTREPDSKRHKGDQSAQSQPARGQGTAAHLTADSAAEPAAGECALNALFSGSQEAQALSQHSSEGDESDMQLQVDRIELQPSSHSQPDSDAIRRRHLRPLRHRSYPRARRRSGTASGPASWPSVSCRSRTST